MNSFNSYSSLLYNTMIRHELNLLQDYRNLDKLNSKLEFKVIDAVFLYESFEEDQLQIAIKSLIGAKSSMIIEALKKQDVLIRDYWSALSYAQSNKNQSNEIIARWKKLENQSIFIRPYLEIAKHYQKLGNNQKACQYYDKCIKTFNECEKAYFLKGQLLLRIGKEEEGINLLKIGSTISKESSQAYEILGSHWERKSQHQEAIKMFQIVQRIHPSKQNQERIETQKKILRKQEEQRRQQKQRKQEQERRQTQQRKEKQQKLQAQLREQERLRRQEQQRRQERIRMQEMQEIQKIQAQFRELERKEKQELRKFQEVELKKHKSAEQTEKKNNRLEEKTSESLKKVPLIEKSRKSEHQPNNNKVINQKSHQNMKVEKSQKSPKKRRQMTIQERQIYKILEQDIVANRNSPQLYFQMIQFLRDKAMQKEVVLCVEELIKNCRRQQQLILPICKKIQQLYHVFERKQKVMDIFKVLQKIHQVSIFGYLYHTSLCIINEDRQEAVAVIKKCKMAIFVDKWFTEQAENKNLFQNYLFLFCSLIAKENMDISSLQALFQIMLTHFEDYYNKKTIQSSSIVRQLILLKNLIVQSTFITPDTFLFLQGVDKQVILQYSTQILVKEEMAYIVEDCKELKRLLKHDCKIIAFPSTLTQLALTIENTKLRLKIMVPSIPKEKVKSPIISAKCKDITGHNGRIRCSEGKLLTQIYEELIKESEEK